ncbi:MAG: hypothetical protein PHF79_00460 [Candidatus Pacebacteria bacterium]|nr:hypothetical protein [Candidatus Paceibacterota bacterium]
MQNFIKKLHEKPESYRHMVALGVSFGVTILIFGIWLHSFIAGLSSNQALAGVAAANPLSALGETISQGYQNSQNSSQK